MIVFLLLATGGNGATCLFGGSYTDSNGVVQRTNITECWNESSQRWGIDLTLTLPVPLDRMTPMDLGGLPCLVGGLNSTQQASNTVMCVNISDRSNPWMVSTIGSALVSATSGTSAIELGPPLQNGAGGYPILINGQAVAVGGSNGTSTAFGAASSYQVPYSGVLAGSPITGQPFRIVRLAQSLLQPRTAAASFAFNGSMCVGGGFYSDSSSATQPMGSTECVDSTTGQWRYGPSFSQPRAAHVVLNLNGWWCLFGGTSSSDGATPATTFECLLSQSLQLSPRPAGQQDLTWRSVLNVYPYPPGFDSTSFLYPASFNLGGLQCVASDGMREVGVTWCINATYISTYNEDSTPMWISYPQMSLPRTAPSVLYTTWNPTPSPTRSPTGAPTTPPPTQSPITSSPITNKPTTSSPTRSPTLSPTLSPSTFSPLTTSPTLSPITTSPTLSPTTRSPITFNPTTLSPITHNPTTYSPTINPSTTSPTFNPTTITPSWSPTTASPTRAPTTTAPTTLSPTTITPTQSPTTITPTRSPTQSPTITLSPTNSPTQSPTRAPSRMPTASPTTAAPNAAPTAAPTTAPTAAPTRSPTFNPTTSPSTVPTTTPTATPTSAPTTTTPTDAPTTSTHQPTPPPHSPSPSPTLHHPTLAPSKGSSHPEITNSPTVVAPSPSSVDPNQGEVAVVFHLALSDNSTTINSTQAVIIIQTILARLNITLPDWSTARITVTQSPSSPSQATITLILPDTSDNTATATRIDTLVRNDPGALHNLPGGYQVENVSLHWPSLLLALQGLNKMDGIILLILLLLLLLIIILLHYRRKALAHLPCLIGLLTSIFSFASHAWFLGALRDATFGAGTTPQQYHAVYPFFVAFAVCFVLPITCNAMVMGFSFRKLKQLDPDFLHWTHLHRGSYGFGVILSLFAIANLAVLSSPVWGCTPAPMVRKTRAALSALGLYASVLEIPRLAVQITFAALHNSASAAAAIPLVLGSLFLASGFLQRCYFYGYIANKEGDLEMDIYHGK